MLALAPAAETRTPIVLRLFDALAAGGTAALLALGLGLPILPALVLGLGTGLAASTLCPVARRSGPSLLGVLLGGLIAGWLAAALGTDAWAQVGLIVATSLLAARLGRTTFSRLRRALPEAPVEE